MDIKKFKKLPIMGIIRGVKNDILEPLIEAIVSSELATIEITMNTPLASKIISNAVKLSRGRLAIGAGTVLSIDDLEKAVSSGASFIVMPTFEPKITEYCVKNKIPVFPGALTPQEIHNAWKGGATMVKVFPSKFFGPSYIKEIKGPFNDIELMACGGVTPVNLVDFFRAGASAVAFGGSIFSEVNFSQKNFDEVKKAISLLVKKYKECVCGNS